ncbi:hypothetical protein F4V43_01655 [Paenibacillus spiritus]|uniref:Uncharacterized protein n=1 Tax=Paenibacillus spiritus TaxID=2496557 RepID=A0A5J5GHN9_9BACL|nr:hypothetical protein [Paenibacillus spiritus]KAA9007218.1 hypothetical protein F4V43_01655 [Paenibacillus spiritus]
MDRKQFFKEYDSVFFTPDPHYEYAFKKWLEYYYQTEVYDRRICSGFDRETGEAIPGNTVEYTEINRYAKQLMNKVVEDLRNKNVDDSTWRLARDGASRHSFEETERLLIGKGWINEN